MAPASAIIKIQRLILITIVLMYVSWAKAQQVPYNTSPDWMSDPNSHRATGLGIADINGDGWKDLVVANGNDMARQSLVVYYNQGDGTFPLNPGWSSDDIDYHGHLACGDLDHDGDIDVVVSVYIGEEGFSSPGKLKIYYNQGSELESNPSFVSEPFYTFSCALGDADGDGDLDIAAAAGEPYSAILDRGRIFINQDGTFQPGAEWKSSVQMGALDVEFGDINRDGYLDVIFVCEGTPNMIYLAGTDGVIDNEPDWQSEELQNYINSVDIGYELDRAVVVMTENSQLGGTGRVRRYDFDGVVPASGAANWYSDPFGYGSGIILNDIDQNGNLDVYYGGWWLPVKIAFGDGTGFQMDPPYTSATSSVVETILLADLGREDEWFTDESWVIGPDHDSTNIIILSGDVVDRIISVYINEEQVSPALYSHIPGKPWLAFHQPLFAGDVVAVNYIYSPYPDMVITNWDSNKGNYIFYNTDGGLGHRENLEKESALIIYPNPSAGYFNILAPNNSGIDGIAITDVDGHFIYYKKLHIPEHQIRVSCREWPSGMYFVEVDIAGRKWKSKLIRL